MPHRSYASTANYRFGFNGKENDNEPKGLGNQQDYGMRVYDARIAKFLSVDPLQKKFPSLSTYQFTGNNPIATIDLDGLEPAAVNPNTKTLVLVLQGFGGVPPDKNTQASNAAKTNKNLGIDMEGLGKFKMLEKCHPLVQVVVYASSTTENTKEDVLATIKNFKAINKNGEVIIIGHSQGGDNAIELLKENSEVKADLLIVFDTQEAKSYLKLNGKIPIVTGIDDNNIYENVNYAINFFQTTEAIGGETLDFESKKTKGYNVKSPGSTHRSIDNDVVPYMNAALDLYFSGKFSLDVLLPAVKKLIEDNRFEPKPKDQNVLPEGVDKFMKKLKSREND